MQIHDDHEVDKAEQITRFLCGAIMGACVALAVIVMMEWTSAIAIVLVLLGAMVGCGLGALFGGDRFWYAFFRLFR